MKKHLLCTSAIALGVAAAPALAQDWNVGVGGYYNTHIGFTDQSGTAYNPGGQLAGTDFDGLEIVQDGEVIITPSITLDNGLTFGATIQYETADGADMDEVYVTVSSDTFGTLDLGSENSAGYKLMWSSGVPTVGGVPINSGSMSGFVPYATSGGGGLGTSVGIANSFVGAGQSQATEVAGALAGNNDIQRITYYTPNFNGFTLGISYAPDAAGGDGAGALSDKNAVMSDIWDIGVAYAQTFQNVDVSFAARWGTADYATGFAPFGIAAISDPETWGVAFQVGVAGWAFGAHYAENDNGLTGGALDEEGWGVGASYDMPGPWSFGIEYFYGEASHGAGNGKDEYSALKLAANRNLGPGVNWAISLIQTEIDAADVATGGLLNGGPGTDLKGTTLATSLNLSF